jgi:hypothetical protein
MKVFVKIKCPGGCGAFTDIKVRKPTFTSPLRVEHFTCSGCESDIQLAVSYLPPNTNPAPNSVGLRPKLYRASETLLEIRKEEIEAAEKNARLDELQVDQPGVKPGGKLILP